MAWLWQCPWSIMNMFLWVIFCSHLRVIFHVVSGRLCCFGMFLGKIKGKWVLKSDTVWRGHVSWHHLRTANLRTHTLKKTNARWQSIEHQIMCYWTIPWWLNILRLNLLCVDEPIVRISLIPAEVVSSNQTVGPESMIGILHVYRSNTNCTENRYCLISHEDGKFYFSVPLCQSPLITLRLVIFMMSTEFFFLLCAKYRP